MEGWIKLHRKFLNWEWFSVSEMVKLFMFLLLSANHEDGNWQGNKVKRGQLITGLNSLHSKTKISHQTLRTCLKRLEKTGEINIQSTNKHTIITICNYESYQGVQQETNNQTNKQLTNDQQTTNNKQECKEEKECEEIYLESGHLSITWKEMNKLIDKYGMEKSDDIVKRILNYRKNSKYKSLYLTAISWLDKEIKQEQQKKTEKPKLAI